MSSTVTLTMERKCLEVQVENELCETVSIEDAYAALNEAFGELDEEYRNRMQQLAMVHAVLAILLEEQGGVIEIEKNLFNGYDLHAAEILMYDPPESDSYIIVVNVNEEQDESSE